MWRVVRTLILCAGDDLRHAVRDVVRRDGNHRERAVGRDGGIAEALERPHFFSRQAPGVVRRGRLRVGTRGENQCGGEAGEALHEIPDSCAHAALMRPFCGWSFPSGKLYGLGWSKWPFDSTRAMRESRA